MPARVPASAGAVPIAMRVATGRHAVAAPPAPRAPALAPLQSSPAAPAGHGQQQLRSLPLHATGTAAGRTTSTSGGAGAAAGGSAQGVHGRGQKRHRPRARAKGGVSTTFGDERILEVCPSVADAAERVVAAGTEGGHSYFRQRTGTAVLRTEYGRPRPVAAPGGSVPGAVDVDAEVAAPAATCTSAGEVAYGRKDEYFACSHGRAAWEGEGAADLGMAAADDYAVGLLSDEEKATLDVEPSGTRLSLLRSMLSKHISAVRWVDARSRAAAADEVTGGRRAPSAEPTAPAPAPAPAERRSGRHTVAADVTRRFVSTQAASVSLPARAPFLTALSRLSRAEVTELQHAGCSFRMRLTAYYSWKRPMCRTLTPAHSAMPAAAGSGSGTDGSTCTSTAATTAARAESASCIVEDDARAQLAATLTETEAQARVAAAAEASTQVELRLFNEHSDACRALVATRRDRAPLDSRLQAFLVEFVTLYGANKNHLLDKLCSPGERGVRLRQQHHLPLPVQFADTEYSALPRRYQVTSHAIDQAMRTSNRRMQLHADDATCAAAFRDAARAVAAGHGAPCPRVRHVHDGRREELGPGSALDTGSALGWDSVLFYREQRLEHSPDGRVTLAEPFSLCFQTFQMRRCTRRLSRLRLLGTCGVDTTHGINDKALHLAVLSGRDEHSSAIPLSFAILQTRCAEQFYEWLAAFCRRNPEFAPRLFVTDLAGSEQEAVRRLAAYLCPVEDATRNLFRATAIVCDFHAKQLAVRAIGRGELRLLQAPLARMIERIRVSFTQEEYLERIQDALTVIDNFGDGLVCAAINTSGAGRGAIVNVTEEQVRRVRMNTPDIGRRPRGAAAPAAPTPTTAPAAPAAAPLPPAVGPAVAAAPAAATSTRANGTTPVTRAASAGACAAAGPAPAPLQADFANAVSGELAGVTRALRPIRDFIIGLVARESSYRYARDCRAPLQQPSTTKCDNDSELIFKIIKIDLLGGRRPQRLEKLLRHLLSQNQLAAQSASAAGHGNSHRGMRRLTRDKFDTLVRDTARLLQKARDEHGVVVAAAATADVAAACRPARAPRTVNIPPEYYPYGGRCERDRVQVLELDELAAIELGESQVRAEREITFTFIPQRTRSGEGPPSAPSTLRARVLTKVVLRGLTATASTSTSSAGVTGTSERASAADTRCRYVQNAALGGGPLPGAAIAAAIAHGVPPEDARRNPAGVVFGQRILTLSVPRARIMECSCANPVTTMPCVHLMLLFRLSNPPVQVPQPSEVVGTPVWCRSDTGAERLYRTPLAPAAPGPAAGAQALEVGAASTRTSTFQCPSGRDARGGATAASHAAGEPLERGPVRIDRDVQEMVRNNMQRLAGPGANPGDVDDIDIADACDDDIEMANDGVGGGASPMTGTAPEPVAEVQNVQPRPGCGATAAAAVPPAAALVAAAAARHRELEAVSVSYATRINALMSEVCELDGFAPGSAARLAFTRTVLNIAVDENRVAEAASARRRRERDHPSRRLPSVSDPRSISGQRLLIAAGAREVSGQNPQTVATGQLLFATVTATRRETALARAVANANSNAISNDMDGPAAIAEVRRVVARALARRE